MFFFVGGITPKIKKLDDQPRSCPLCGRLSLYRVRVDHYLNLFFIPLFAVKKGQSFFLCENCEQEFSEESGSVAGTFQGFRPHSPQVCPSCGRLVENDFRYCPYCGRSLN